MSGPAFLTGDRIELCTAETEDVEFLQEAVSDPSIWKAVGRNTPYNLEQEREFFQNVFCNQQSIHLLITVGNDPIGVVAFEGIDNEVGTAEINYWIVPSSRREGYGTEAVDRFVQYGFDQLHFHKIVARVSEFNDPSKRLLERIGFAEEGVQREQEFIDGTYQDRHWYGIVEHEWRDREPNP